MKKIEIFLKFALKNRFIVCEIAWKNKIEFFDPDPRPPNHDPPNFKPDWRRCVKPFYNKTHF